MKIIYTLLLLGCFNVFGQSPVKYVVVTNATGKILVPQEVMSRLAANSNRVAFLKKKMADEQAQYEADNKLTWAKQGAGKMSAIAADADQRARSTAMFARFKPMDKEIAERRLADMELRRAYKIPEP